MPAATAPVRVPRRPRGSLSGASGQSPTDEISHLSLAEVRDRLGRNERVLNSALFSTSPGGMPNGASAMSPGSSRASGSDDPVRARLLAVRASLCAREAELMAESMGSMDLSAGPMASSPPTRSAKANALAAIRQGEAVHPPSHMTLPIDSTLALGERDFDNQWTARFANVGIETPASSRNPSSRGSQREDALERSERASRRARATVDEDDNVFDTDEAYAAAGVYASQRHDLGNGLPLATARARRQEGYDDDMRSDGSRGEDGEYPEGNDEYEGDGTNTLDAAPR
ncbi:hypothetical protein CC85DRAFT_283193 [Cutaneotrichosporon oleaginosum]|uniref:Uncharacterized protein n=1 Tax=Cutaneotrichosporon oleaginosum TaxID=879819 RepID=A0A0J0XUX5_9TREE|nr:uncharacterized protein CC85DRAFT_283193 [Cutaneotrichosporon oleaginosum]KLT44885.1 hypothetical protein CC85DRAFT_283193 [Cutaneotrichosporon oleaginosum]TXT12016.1 hypothetical protein COLE_02426 [Cutaneotrichosporon oleaginosum]